MSKKTISLAHRDHLSVSTSSPNPGFVRFAAIALAAAGLLFVLYPSLRPFSDEATMRGAAAFASTDWLISHMMAILAFVLMNIGLLGLFFLLQGTSVEKLVLRSLVLIGIGVGLTLPFYGAEVFSLHAIGREVIARQNTDLMQLSNDIRFGPGLFMIAAGLLLAAIGSVLTAVSVWKSRTLPKWSGIPFAFGILLYLPQYTGTQPVRVAHGLALAAGCVWIAAGIWKQSRHKKLPA